MIRFYFIPLVLKELLKSLQAKAKAEGINYFCLRAVQPQTPEEEETVPTGIESQTGEIYINIACKGFLLEGNLEALQDPESQNLPPNSPFLRVHSIRKCNRIYNL